MEESANIMGRYMAMIGKMTEQLLKVGGGFEQKKIAYQPAQAGKMFCGNHFESLGTQEAW